MPRPDLDALDLAILDHHQRNPQRPAVDIGQAVGLSTAAVQRRIKRMREAGVTRDVVQLDPAALGLTVTCIVEVQLVSDTAAGLARFRGRAVAAAEVQQCYYVTGPNDFVLIVVVADLAAYEAFTRGPVIAGDDVAKFTSHVVLGRDKVSLDLPVPR